jgi:hypothetical protein
MALLHPFITLYNPIILQSYNPTILLLAFVIGSHGNYGKRQTQKMGGKQNLSACIRAGALADYQGRKDLHER